MRNSPVSIRNAPNVFIKRPWTSAPNTPPMLNKVTARMPSASGIVAARIAAGSQLMMKYRLIRFMVYGTHSSRVRRHMPSANKRRTGIVVPACVVGDGNCVALASNPGAMRASSARTRF